MIGSISILRSTFPCSHLHEGNENHVLHLLNHDSTRLLTDRFKETVQPVQLIFHRIFRRFSSTLAQRWFFCKSFFGEERTNETAIIHLACVPDLEIRAYQALDGQIFFCLQSFAIVVWNRNERIMGIMMFVNIAHRISIFLSAFISCLFSRRVRTAILI